MRRMILVCGLVVSLVLALSGRAVMSIKAAPLTVPCQIKQTGSTLAAGKRITVANAAQLQQIGMIGRSPAFNGTHWSPDGHVLIVDTYIGLWFYDAQAWDKPPQFYALPTTTSFVAFSPNSHSFAVQTSDFTIQIIELTTLQTSRTLSKATGSLKEIALSQDGKWLAASSQESLKATLQVWDTTNGQLVAHYPTTITEGQDLAYAPVFVNDHLYFLYHDAVYVWDMTSQRERKLRDTPSATVMLASPDGKTLAIQSDSQVWLYSLPSDHLETTVTLEGQEQIRTSQFDRSGVLHILLDTDNGVVSGQVDAQRGTVSNAKLLQSPNSDSTTQLSLYELLFSPDALSVVDVDVMQSPEPIRVWDTQTGALRLNLRSHMNGWYGAGALDVAMFSLDSLHIAVAGRDGVQVVNVRTGQAEAVIGEHTSIEPLNWSADNTITWMRSTPDQTFIQRQQLTSNHNLIQALPFGLENLTVSADGTLLAYAPPLEADHGPIVVQDIQTGRILHTLDVRVSGFGYLGFSPDNRYLVVTGSMGSDVNNAQLQFWDMTTGALRQTWPVKQFPNPVFSVDSRLFAFNQKDGSLILLNAATLDTIRVFADAANAAFSPDLHWLAYEISSQKVDRTLVWDLTTYAPYAVFEGGINQFSPDSKGLLTAISGKDAHDILWDVATTKPQGQYAWASQFETGFSPDSTLLALSVEDQVTIYRTETAEPVLTIQGCSAGDVAFSPDGRFLHFNSGGVTLIWGISQVRF